jgi:hypothetical protein
MFNIYSSLVSKINQLGEEVAKSSTVALQTHATDTYNWPPEVASNLSVLYKNGTFPAHHADESDHEVKTLELGTQDLPPAPAIRTFMGAY